MPEELEDTKLEFLDEASSLEQVYLDYKEKRAKESMRVQCRWPESEFGGAAVEMCQERPPCIMPDWWRRGGYHRC